ncbi:MAG TPA: hypothetical protein VM510_03855 [Caulifigura sp.]|nr:hypothetical protein [Caulifigura sp.]
MSDSRPESSPSAPDRDELIRKGFEFLDQLKSKPPLPPETAARMGGGPWLSPPPRDPDADKPLF